MFKSLKNKIREETGSDVSRIGPLIGGTGSSQKATSFKGRHSRQGSTSSIGSLSIDGIREERSLSPGYSENGAESHHEDIKTLSPKDNKQIEKRDEEWKGKLNKLEIEWKRKMDEKEKEWKIALELINQEKLSNDKKIGELQKALSDADEFKEKYCQFQEEKKQLEGFQTQEMAKVKHLLLAKERELSEKLNALKENEVQISSLKSEVARLRRFEEEISNIQVRRKSMLCCS